MFLIKWVVLVLMVGKSEALYNLTFILSEFTAIIGKEKIFNNNKEGNKNGFKKTKDCYTETKVV